MQPLKPGQLANIRCESIKKTTLYTWVDEDVVEGEMIKFSNYENYKGEWIVKEIIQVDTYDHCAEKWGKEDWFLRKIEHIELSKQYKE